MKWTHRLNHTGRILTVFLLITYSAACTHLPSGEKAFKTFESCFAANLGLATVGGIGAGILATQLAGGLTGSHSAARNVGTAAGVAVGVMIAMKAWKSCAAVYNKSEVVTPPTPTARPSTSGTATTQTPRLSLDSLKVRVDGTENDPPQPEFALSYLAASSATRDIKAKFRHKVEIVRFTSTDDNKMILADNSGNAMHDSAGKTIPLEAAARMPRSQLAWVSIAEDGRDDYIEDVVIQQGASAIYRHKLQIPPRAQLPLPLPVPMRYTLAIEADNMTTTRNVDFFILNTADRPKLYAASGANAAANAATTPTTRSLKNSAPASGNDGGTKTNRKVTLYSDTSAQRKSVGVLLKGITVTIEDRATAIINNKPSDWVKISSDKGSGWLPADFISGAR